MPGISRETEVNIAVVDGLMISTVIDLCHCVRHLTLSVPLFKEHNTVSGVKPTNLEVDLV